VGLCYVFIFDMTIFSLFLYWWVLVFATTSSNANQGFINRINVQQVPSKTNPKTPIFSDIFIKSHQIYAVAQRYPAKNSVKYKNLVFSLSVDQGNINFTASSVIEQPGYESCIILNVNSPVLKQLSSKLVAIGETHIKMVIYNNNYEIFEVDVPIVDIDVITNRWKHNQIAMFSLVSSRLPYDELSMWVNYHAKIGIGHFILYYQGYLDEPRIPRQQVLTQGQGQEQQGKGVSAISMFEFLAKNVDVPDVTFTIAEWNYDFWGGGGEEQQQGQQGQWGKKNKMKGNDRFHTSQLMAQQSALYRSKFRCKWLAFFDTDEFITVNPKFPSLRSQLKSYSVNAISHVVFWNSYFILFPKELLYSSEQQNKEIIQKAIVTELTAKTFNENDIIRERDLFKQTNRPKFIANVENVVLVGVHDVRFIKDGKGMQGSQSFYLHHLSLSKGYTLRKYINDPVKTTITSLLQLPRQDIDHFSKKKTVTTTHFGASTPSQKYNVIPTTKVSDRDINNPINFGIRLQKSPENLNEKTTSDPVVDNKGGGKGEEVRVRVIFMLFVVFAITCAVLCKVFFLPQILSTNKNRGQSRP